MPSRQPPRPPIDSTQDPSMPVSTYDLHLDDRVKRIQDENTAVKQVKEMDLQDKSYSVCFSLPQRKTMH